MTFGECSANRLLVRFHQPPVSTFTYFFYSICCRRRHSCLSQRRCHGYYQRPRAYRHYRFRCLSVVLPMYMVKHVTTLQCSRKSISFDRSPITTVSLTPVYAHIVFVCLRSVMTQLFVCCRWHNLAENSDEVGGGDCTRYQICHHPLLERLSLCQWMRREAGLPLT